jgi:hypothetical protein
MLLPRPDHGVVAAEPPGTGPGYWAGAPCAVAGDGEIFLAYRLRRPIAQGRGLRGGGARSADGERFETVATIGKDDMDTESLERPALVRTPGGRWRLYLSCATTGTKHWRVEVTEAPTRPGFDAGTGRPSARRRQDRREGSGDRVPPRPVAPVGVLPPAGRPAADRPDDYRVRDQRRRPDLDMARHRAERDAGPVGLPRRAGRRGALRRGRGHGLVRRPGQRRGELRGADRGATGSDPAALTAVSDRPLAGSPYQGGGLRYLDIVPLPDGHTGSTTR